MAITNQMTDNHTSGADAIANARNNKAAQAVGNDTTARGTVIRKSNTEFDKNSFLKILSAQLTNLDPTSDQDSTAYVTQMAQFTQMEQTANLNETMSNSANQQLLGKRVILDEKYADGSYVKGDVQEVIKKSAGTFLTVLIDGKKEEIPLKKVIGVADTTSSNTISNNKAAINSDFLAASALAADKKSVVVAQADENGKITFVKGKVTGAYIDAVNSAKVKIKVDVSGTGDNKVYNYEDIIKAGDLTDEEMDTAIKEAEDELAKLNATDTKTADSTDKTPDSTDNEKDSIDKSPDSTETGE